MENFGKFCLGIIALITTSIVAGYVFMKMWEWFIAHYFSIQQVNLIQSIGLVLFINLLTTKKERKSEKDITKFIGQFIMEFLIYAMTLCGGWVLTLFQ